MEETREYRPAWIEFDVVDDEIPQILGGEFEDLAAATKFIHDNSIAEQLAMTVNRHMDEYERRRIREQYMTVLEEDLPRLGKQLSVATVRFNEAKKERDDAQSMINSSFTEVELLAKEAKSGTKMMRLETKDTFKIPYRDRYYFFTYCDKRLKLCSIREIGESDKKELFTRGVDNSKLFNLEPEKSDAEKYLNDEISANEFAVKDGLVNQEGADLLFPDKTKKSNEQTPTQKRKKE